MNLRMIYKVLGFVLMIIALCLVIPLLVSLYYRGTDTLAFVSTIAITGIVGFMLALTPIENDRSTPEKA
jgi:trk system potassium uptake protein TrkH